MSRLRNSMKTAALTPPFKGPFAAVHESESGPEAEAQAARPAAGGAPARRPFDPEPPSASKMRYEVPSLVSQRCCEKTA
jgi:hypothetical protein